MTTVTINSIALSARDLLDVSARNHFTINQMSKYVAEGLRRLYAVRPASRMSEAGGALYSSLPLDAAEVEEASVVINEERWIQGVVYYAAALAHEAGVTDSVNLQLAQTLKKQADEIFTA